jgi:hypothetical protein
MFPEYEEKKETQQQQKPEEKKKTGESVVPEYRKMADNIPIGEDKGQLRFSLLTLLLRSFSFSLLLSPFLLLLLLLSFVLFFV